MYKLVALDIDGTTVNSKKEITPRTKQAIQAAREQSVTVVLASGRPIDGMLPLLKELNMTTEKDYVISYNAALVQNVKTEEVLYSQLITGADTKLLTQLAKDLEVDIHTFSTKHGLLTPISNEYTHLEADLNNIAFNEYDLMSLEDDHPIIKTMLVAHSDKLDEITPKLPATVYEQFSVVRSAHCFLEFLHPTCHKGTGVKILAEKLDIKQEEVICIGDAENDHKMIEYAGLGVAMANADEKTKSLANHITDTNDNDGVAKVIEEFVLNS